MNTKYSLSILCLLAGLVFGTVVEAADPVVSNVRASQRPGTKLVDILYDVADADGGPLTITLEVSDNSGTNYAVPSVSCSGDLGANVTTGLNKQIVWNAGADWNQRFTNTMYFKVTASDVIPAPPSGMAFIPSGTFTMGDSSGDGDVDMQRALPTHSVTLSAFYMDKYPVTKALWDSVAIPAVSQGYSFSAGSGLGKGTNHPVHTVNWYDVVRWCNARSQQEGKIPVYYTDTAFTTIYKAGDLAPYANWSANGYRLPTEAEWEYAARGGLAGKRFPWGDTITHSQANYNTDSTDSYDISPTKGYHPVYNDGTTPNTSPVGSFAPNGYGLYDMAGNVYNWCWDWYNFGDNYQSSPGNNPHGPASGSFNVLRGGSWNLFGHYCRSAYRNYGYPGTRYGHDLGFRLVLAQNLAASTPSAEFGTLTVDTRDSVWQPQIAVQPQGQTVPTGGNLYLQVTVQGLEPFAYQWRKNGANLIDGGQISGANANKLQISNAQIADTGVYSLDISNGYGSVTSQVAVAIVKRTGEQAAEGKVIGWGRSLAFPMSGSGNTFTKISAGTSHNLALTGDGKVIAWGYNSDGQCTVASGLTGVVSVAAGGYHGLALKGDGTVVAWGAGSPGSSTAYPHNCGQSTVPNGLSGVIAIAAGGYHSLALKGDGTVVAWGAGGPGTSLGGENFYQSIVPSGLGGVVAIAAGTSHSLALKGDGTVVAWGRSDYDLCAVPTGLGGVVAIAAGATHSLALKGDGTVVAWGRNDYGQSTIPIGLNGVISIAAGHRHSMALKGDGTVVAWGDNGYGQTTVPNGLNGVASISAGLAHSMALKWDGTIVAWGLNTDDQCTDPSGMSGIVAVAVGGDHQLALKGDGTVVAWGNNSSGQCAVPSGLDGVVSIAAGGGHSMALKGDGTVVAWGNNYDGQITVPNGLNGVVAISAGYRHSLALKWDGIVVDWGYRGYGSVPNGLGEVVAIAAGYDHSLALKGNGTVVAWGDNRFGETTVPSGLSGVVAIAANYHSIALKGDGTIVAWGNNYYGQSTVPIGLNGVIAIAAGRDHSLALKGDGTLFAWGINTSGESTIPNGLSRVISVAAGGAQNLALYGSPPFIPVQLQYQNVVAGTDIVLHVTAQGSEPFAYQWRKDGTNMVNDERITGTSSSQLSITNCLLSDAGNYSVIIENTYGAVTSQVAVLTVHLPYLTSATAGSGTVTSSPNQAQYTNGQSVTLTATPARWYQFVRWSDGVTNNPRAITIGANNNYTAVFSNTVSLEWVAYKQWERVYGGTGGDAFSNLALTDDGGYILGGWSSSGISGNKTTPSLGGYDYWVVKVDAYGAKQWETNYGGTGDDLLQTIQQTSDGGFILGGQSSSGVSGNKTTPGFGGWDYWVVKVDANGGKQWETTYGGAGDDALHSIQQVGSGGYILAGFSLSGITGNKTTPSLGGYDYWVVKVDAYGAKQWETNYGGTGDDILQIIQQTRDGGYILGGPSSSVVSGNKTTPGFGGWDYWAIKVDANGGKLWEANYGGTEDDFLFSFKETSDGGGILAGYSSSGVSGNKTSGNYGDRDCWVVKVDANGVKMWETNYGGLRQDEVNSVLQTRDGGYLLAGFSYSDISGNKTSGNYGDCDIWVLKLDANGAKQWESNYGGTGSDFSRHNAMQFTPDGGFIMAGYTGNAGLDDGWIIKIALFEQPVGAPKIAVNGQFTTATNLVYTETNAVQIVFETTFTNGVVWYTLDGSTPTTNSLRYTGPLVVTNTNAFSATTILRALAYSGDMTQSALADPLTVDFIAHPSEPIVRSIYCTVQGGGTIAKSPEQTSYTNSQVLTLIATPAPWYTFLRWADGNTQNPRTITIGANNNYTAVFTNTVPLETWPQGTNLVELPVGMPRIYVNGQLANGVTMTNILYTNTPVMLTLTSSWNGPVHYTLDESEPDYNAAWSGGSPIPVIPPATIKAIAYGDDLYLMTGLYVDYTEVATARLEYLLAYQFALASSGSGTVIAGIGGQTNPPLASGQWPVVSNTVVTLAATPAAGWEFSHYALAGSGSWLTETQAAFTVRSNTTITAVFTQIPVYTLAATVPGGGSVAINPPTDPVLALPPGQYLRGTSVTVTATNLPDWTFLGWSGAWSGSQTPVVCTMNSNVNVTATFGAPVASSVVGSGTIARTPDQALYPYGSALRLTAQPAASKFLAYWSGSVTGPISPALLVVTNSSLSVTGTFGTLPVNYFSLVAQVAGEGSVAYVPATNRFASNAVVTITATPAPAWAFAGWVGDTNGAATDNGSLTLTMNTNKVITANFEWGVGPQIASITPTNQTVLEGSNVTITVTAAGSVPLAYQWRKNGTNLTDGGRINGSVSNQLAIANSQLNDAGNYTVIITNAFGSITSQVASLTVSASSIHGFVFDAINGLGTGGGIASWQDMDGDGDDDLYLGGYWGASRLFRNDGGVLVDITGNSALGQSLCGGLGWGDYDNDGLPDLMVTHWDWGTHYLFHNDGSGNLTVVGGFPTPDHGGQPLGRVCWLDLNNDGNLDFFITCGNSPHLLYMGDGKGGFSRASGPAFLSFSGGPSGCWPADFNGDRLTDMLLWTQSGLALHLNDGNLAFHEVAIDGISGLEVAAVADFNQDGYLDFLAGNGTSSGYSIFFGIGQGQFRKTAMNALSGISATWRTATAADFDNDGDIDLVISEWRDTQGTCALLENRGDGEFVLRERKILDDGYFDVQSNSDYDGDGAVDTLISRGWNGATQILKNRGNANQWLKVQLSGTKSNRSAIGTTVRVKARINGIEQWQMRQVLSTAGYGGHDSRTLHFGLGNASEVELVRIEWPSGLTQEIPYVSPKQLLQVTEPAVAIPAIVSQPESRSGLLGQTISLAVTASGTPPLIYQWRKDGTNLVDGGRISGATTTNLNLTAVQLSDAGNYTVLITNSYGSVTSQVAALNISVTPTNLLQGLVAYYPFNGNANDASGNGNFGTVNGAVLTQDRFNEPGMAYAFNGSNSFISFNIPNIPTGATPRSVSLWVAAQPDPSHGVNLFFWGANAVNQGFGLMNNGSPYTWDAQAWGNDVSSGVIVNTNWHHVVVVYSGTTLSIAIDGVQNAAGSRALDTPLSLFTVGANPWGETLYFRGTIDDIRIYDRALSGTEITQLYAQENTPPNIPPTIIAQTTNQTFSAGSSATFSVTAGGTPPFSYQWRKDGTNLVDGGRISGATTTNLNLTAVQLSDAGNYTVLITNSYGSVTSQVAALTALPNFSEGLVAYYPFNGNANDASGNGHDGMVNNATLSSDRFGIPDRAYSFNSGNLSFIDLAPVRPVIEGLSRATFSIWSLEQNGQQGGVLFADWGNNYGAIDLNLGLVIELHNGKVSFSNNSGYGGIETLSAVSMASWHHLVVVFDGTIGSQPQRVKITVDGVAMTNEVQASLRINPTIGFGTGTFLGRRNFDFGAFGSYFDGNIDDIRIYNRALSDTEVAQLYTLESTPPTALPTIAAQITNQSVVLGNMASFSVTTAGTPPFSYQWRLNGTNLANGGRISGATTTNLNLTAVQSSDAGNYTVVITNSYGSVTSQVALLTVQAPPGLSDITNQTINQDATLGPVAFTISDADTPLTNLLVSGSSSNQGLVPNGNIVLGGSGANRTVTITPAAGQSGTATITISVSDGFASASDTFLLTVLANSLTVNVTIVGGGSVTKSPNKTVYAPGENVTLTAIPTAGQQFAGWSGDLIGTNNPATLVVNGNRAVTATFAALAAPVVLRAATNLVAVAGSNAVLWVEAGGGAPLSYQWQVQDNYVWYDLPGETGTNYVIAAATVQDSGSYRVVVRNSAGTATSETMTLTVVEPPQIRTQPLSQSVSQGSTVDLRVTVIGSAPMSYQWRLNTANLAGATTNVLHLANIQPTNSGDYTVVAANRGGAVTSAVARVLVSGPPTIVSQPQGTNVVEGAEASFSVQATGAEPLNYQWHFNGVLMEGQNQATLVVSNLLAINAGEYQVLVGNPYGSLLSDPAMLTVVTAGTNTTTQVRGEYWVTDGRVAALAEANGALYIGGEFATVWPHTGSGAVLDPLSGTVNTGFPDINGEVDAVASDGAGGWFIGGNFTVVGGLPRQRLAHLLSGKQVDPDWAPSVNAPVLAMALSEGKLYIGGSFTNINGQMRNRLAALNTLNGAPDTWHPDVDGPVYALAVAGSTLYAGGQFGLVKGQARQNVAALPKLGSGEPVPSWNPGASHTVLALSVGGDGTLYLGGQFQAVAGQSRKYLAALNAEGILQAWNPGPNNRVFALAVSGTTVYAGGDFTMVGSASRGYLAGLAADAVNGGSPTSWSPVLNNTVFALAVGGGNVYVGGQFSAASGQGRSKLAAYDTVTGSLRPWNPNANGTVKVLASASGAVYAGGQFNIMGPQPRSKLAAMDLQTGQLLPWNPAANGNVWSLAMCGTNLIAGGDFTWVGGRERHFVAGLDLGTGLASTWDPSADGPVRALAARDNLVYAGGAFQTIGSQARRYVASLELNSNVARAEWNPGVDNLVLALAVSGSTVYLGGDFGVVSGTNRSCLAAVDAVTGVLKGWDPMANDRVQTLSCVGSNVYAGGDFTQIGGQARTNVAALDGTTGAVRSWNAGLQGQEVGGRGSVASVREENGLVYVGGGFNRLGGQARQNLGVVSASSGGATSWRADVNGPVSALSVSGGAVYVGGQFSQVGEYNRPNLAVIVPKGPPSLISQPLSQTVVAGPDSSVTLRVIAGGQSPLYYQWSFKGTNIAGATNSTLTFNGVYTTNAGTYQVVVSNLLGVITSGSAFLTVNAMPTITSHLTNIIVSQYSDVAFTASAAGSPPFSYQWRLNGVNIPNATNATYTITNAVATNSGSYSYAVQNNYGSVNSDPFVLIVDPGYFGMSDRFADRPWTNSAYGSIRCYNTNATHEAYEPLSHVKNGTKYGNQSVWLAWRAPATGMARFSTRGSGFDTLLAVYAGTNMTTLTNVVCDEDGGGFLTSAVSFNAVQDREYQIVVDGLGRAKGHIILKWEMEVATDDVPEIDEDVVAQTTAKLGQKVMLKVKARNRRGTEEGLRYQWYCRSQPVPQATNSTLTIDNVQLGDIGNYVVEVYTQYKRIASAPAHVEIWGGNQSLTDLPNTEDKLFDVVKTLNGGQASPQGLNRRRKANTATPGLETTGSQLLSNFGATKEMYEPNHAGEIGGSSRWFTITPEQDGLLWLDTAGSAVPVVLAVYEGSEISSLSLKGSDNNPENGVAGLWFPATAATNYLVAVDAKNGANGKINLNWLMGSLPGITNTLVDQAMWQGGTVSLSVGATGYPVPAYQWLFNGQPLSGETGSTLTLNNVTVEMTGKYSVQMSNVFGVLPSLEVQVTVTNAAPLVSHWARNADTLTLLGRGFDLQLANNQVWFGPVRAAVLSGNSTQLVVRIPLGAAYGPVSVANPYGRTYSAQLYLPVYAPGALDQNSYNLAMPVSAGSGVSQTLLGDIDGDGLPDLVVLDQASSTISVYQNTSANRMSIYTNRFDVATPGGPVAAALGDLDGDGRLDLAVVSQTAEVVSVYRNVGGSWGANLFSERVGLSAGARPSCVALGDLDGDGRLDIAVGNMYDSSISLWRNQSVAGLMSPASFATRLDLPSPGWPVGVAIGDMDGDGRLDLVTVDGFYEYVTVYRNEGLGANWGVNGVSRTLGWAGPQPAAVGLGDVDGDGRVDVIVANEGNNTVSVLRNTSSSSVALAARVEYSVGSKPKGLALGDVDGDGKLDVLAACDNGVVSVLRNAGLSQVTPGLFAAALNYAAGAGVRSIVMGDVNGDNLPELGVATGTGVVLLQQQRLNQTITFGALGDRLLGEAPFALGATASSGLPVSYAVVSGPSTLNGNVLTLTGGGVVVIEAQQAGDGHYLAAAAVRRSFTVRLALAVSGTSGGTVTGVGGGTVANLIWPSNGGRLESFTSQYAATWGAAMLTDGGKTGSGASWCSPVNPGPQSFVWSFANQQVAQMEEMVVYNYGEGASGLYCRAFSVYTSLDGQNWTPQLIGELLAQEGPQRFNLGGATGCYVKLVITSGYQSDYWELSEVEVMGRFVYDSGTSMTINATPDNGYRFVNWTENGNVVSSSASYTFAAETNRNLVANFVAVYAVGVSASAGGTATGSGIYDSGSSVTVTATPNTGYRFVNWTESSAEVSTAANLVFTVATNRTLLANFASAVVTSNLIAAASGGTLASFTAEYHASWGAAKLTDGGKGGAGASWCGPANPGPQSFVWSLAGMGQLDELVVYNFGEGAYYCRGFVVSTSTNGQTWTPQYNGELLAQEGPQRFSLGGMLAQYVKLTITSGYRSDYWELGEVEVLGRLTPENLALPAKGGKLESFTAEYHASWGAAKLTDGGPSGAGASWASPANPGPQSFVWSFGPARTAQIEGVAVYNYGEGVGGLYSRGFTVQTSLDGQNWTPQMSGELLAQEGAQRFSFGPVLAQFLKLTITSGYRSDYWELGEVEVLGKLLPENLLAAGQGGKLESFTAEYHSSWGAAKLTDGGKGGAGVSWCGPANPGPQSFVWSLGGMGQITEVVVYNFGEDASGLYCRGFSVQTSTDGQSWTQQLSGELLAQEGPQRFSLGGVTSCFLKLTITSGYRSDYWELGEVEVLGKLLPENLLSTGKGGKLESFTAEYHASWGAAKLTDGVKLGYEVSWASPANPEPQAFVWSFANLARIEQVVLYNYGEGSSGLYSRGFTVQTSLDGQSWTPQLTGELLAQEEAQLFPVGAVGRYLKLTITSGYRSDYWELGEVEVLGQAVAGSENLLLPAKGGTLESFTAEYHSTWGAVMLTDGGKSGAGASWCGPENPGPQSFVWSFAQQRLAQLDELVVYNYGEGTVYYSRGFTVYSSLDNQTWTPQVSGELQAQEGPQRFNLGGVTGRYVKLVIASGYQSDYWELGEVEVMGTLK